MMNPGRGLLSFAGTALVTSTCWAISTTAPTAHTHMSEELRASVESVVVLGSTAPASQEITGSYEEQTPGLVGGMNDGANLGRGFETQLGGIPINFPIPILTLPGAVFGALSGAAKAEIQEFRDQLTEELARDEHQPLKTDALAMDVFWNLRNVPELDSKVLALATPIPKGTDAVLFVNLKQLSIDIDDDDAVLTTSAVATLRRVSDGTDLYKTNVVYEDRDTLKNWTKDDNALWRDYANFARHYIGREIAAEVFDGVEVSSELVPRETNTVKRLKRNDWQGITKKLNPTLAWDQRLLGGSSYGGDWAYGIDKSNISYDIEIYDEHRRVYAASNIGEPQHTVTSGLEACRTYRWSVRPVYTVSADTKSGPWMRADGGAGNIGRKASAAPAYTQDFASLKVKCGSK